MREGAKSFRCAVYTRKSTEEGLEMDFNSLQAQREACEAYIRSQRSEGWKLIPKPYDDGGISGGTMERPALQRLMADIEAGQLDVVVVYKVDRLTRSLHDFSRMVEVFDRKGVFFVAVTQQFNTTTSMGRLTLNVLLSFAQFEREVTAERIRDKVAASKRKGIWMGGGLPRGYRVEDRKLLVVPAEAEVVKGIFGRYLRCDSVRDLALALRTEGIQFKPRGNLNDRPMSRGALYTLLRNPIYIGLIPHKGQRYLGQHEGIIDQTMWDAVQAKLDASKRCGGRTTRKADPSPLMGKLFDERGRLLTPTHASTHGRRYRYYVSHEDDRDDDRFGRPSAKAWRLPAAEIESKVDAIVRQALLDRAGILAAASAAGWPASARESLLERIHGLGLVERLSWVERVVLEPNRADIQLALPGPTIVRIGKIVQTVLTRRGRERRVVVGMTKEGSDAVDPRLLKSLSLAFRFWEQLNSELPMSAQEFARAEGVDKRFLGRSLPLAFLAPNLVRSISEGKQAASLTAEQLLRVRKLPVDWALQEAQLG